jgi:hypothetical protein
MAAFAKQPMGFFKGRKPLWWAWWLVRAGGLVAVFIGFILLLRNFYEWRNTCSWCKHLSCLVSLHVLIFTELRKSTSFANCCRLAYYYKWRVLVRHGQFESYYHGPE